MVQAQRAHRVFKSWPSCIFLPPSLRSPCCPPDVTGNEEHLVLPPRYLLHRMIGVLLLLVPPGNVHEVPLETVVQPEGITTTATTASTATTATTATTTTTAPTTTTATTTTTTTRRVVRLVWTISLN